MATLEELFGPVIHAYTRQDQIADGSLVDVSETKEAKELGFHANVAVSRRVWDEIITPDPRSVPYGQSVEGRLWDSLWMLKLAIKARGRATDYGLEFRHAAYFILKERQRRLIRFRSFLAPDENDQPTLTIWLLDEPLD